MLYAILMQLYETPYPIGQYDFVCDVFDVEEDNNDDRDDGGHGVGDDGDDSGDVDGDGAHVEPHHRKSVGRRPC